MDLITLVGLAAAILTTACNWPQLRKCWVTRSAGDISLRMLLTLAAGQTLWIVYGVLKSDWVIILANVVSIFLVAGILYFKLFAGEAHA